MDQLPRLTKRELICLLLFTFNYVLSVWRGFLFLWVLGMGYVILLWHSLSLPYDYFAFKKKTDLLNKTMSSFNGALIAQLGEHLTLDCKVRGSILTQGAALCP